MAEKFMTIDASASATGVDYAAYLAAYFAEQGTAPADPFGGDVQYYNSTFYASMGGYYDGTQVGIRHPDSTNQNQILIEGANMQYDGIVGVHGSYSGSADSVTFGYYDSNTLSVENGSQRSTLIGVLQELKISGLDILEQVGAGNGADNAFYQLMTALRNGNSDVIATGNTLTNGELAIQKLYEMFNAKAQYFIGSDSEDTYVGTRFGDRIDGNAGIDALSGGKGKDVFIFDLDDSGWEKADADTILDFNAKQDRIDLHLIDTNLEMDGDQKFKFIGERDFTGGRGQISYERDGNQTLVHIDSDGDSIGDMTIILEGKFKLNAGDFIL